MNTVGGLLQLKNDGTWTIAPDAPVQQALRMMAEREIGAVMVVESERLIGIFTERDYVRRIAARGLSPEHTPIRAVMTDQVIVVKPSQTVQECMVLMTDHHMRHLPVVESGRVIGMVSMRDVVRHIITEQEFLIEQLTSYITDRAAAAG